MVKAQNHLTLPIYHIVVPITDDTTLVAITFRFWVISTFFGIVGAVIQQYYVFRNTPGTFSNFFVNLASYAMGRAMARILPTEAISIGKFSLSLNPGPFNIKEHALIGIAVSTAASAAYAIIVLSAMDLYLHLRINALGSLLLILTTQCVGYGMAGMLRKYLVYPAEMVWWPNLIQVVFYNAIHNTDEFRTRRMIRGWSYMKFFWVFCFVTFIYQVPYFMQHYIIHILIWLLTHTFPHSPVLLTLYFALFFLSSQQFLPQYFAPVLVYFDWACWISPFNRDIWAIFSSIFGGGVFALSFDWNSIGGTTMYYPLSAQLCTCTGNILSYWIILPIMWLTNALGTRTFGRPLTSSLFYQNGTKFDINGVLKPDFSLDVDKYNAGKPAVITPLNSLLYFYRLDN
jgi:OPT family oligopeptide transporter